MCQILHVPVKYIFALNSVMTDVNDGVSSWFHAGWWTLQSSLLLCPVVQRQEANLPRPEIISGPVLETRDGSGIGFIFPVKLGGREGKLLHYLVLGSLLLIFVWLVRLFRTQLLAGDAGLELTFLHSPSGSSSSSLPSLSSSLRTSAPTYGEKFKDWAIL